MKPKQNSFSEAKVQSFPADDEKHTLQEQAFLPAARRLSEQGWVARGECNDRLASVIFRTPRVSLTTLLVHGVCAMHLLFLLPASRRADLACMLKE
jgi:hypothetical protein